MQTYSATKRIKSMNAQASCLRILSFLVMCIVAVLLLASAGCASQPPVPQVSVYRPPAPLMQIAPTQYLLPEDQQRKTP